MLKKTLAVRPGFKIVVTSCEGDLRLTGWERDEVSAKTDGDTLELALNGDKVTISCDDDLILNVPRAAPVQVDRAAGDVVVRTVTGGLSLDAISGDLALREVGAVAIGSLEGDLSLRGGNGPLSAGGISGDVSIRDVQGDVNLPMVESDLYVRGVTGNLNARTQSDAALYLEPGAGAAINVTAEDDILLHLPSHANAALALTADDAENIDVQIPAAMISGKNPCSVILGDGSAVINLKSEGDILVTSESSEWDEVTEFANFGEGWGIPGDLSEQINRRVQDAARRAQDAARRAQRQAEAATRRVDQKMRQQERRFAFNWGGRRGGFPAPPAQPVSDEERMAILRMLQEKKISAEDAEKLLAALEGGA
ncbi:MAG: hypothetical protein HFACDABA_01626 [Anaerolineales bacterium]|nr:hypothetical protein [Anaerolineales bacterium]